MPRLRTVRRHVAAAAARVPTVRNVYQWERRTVSPRLRAIARDFLNRSTYGPDAPRFGERLWIDPLRVREFKRHGSAYDSGRVVTTEWSESDHLPMEGDPVLVACIARFERGVPWEDTGEVERMERAIRKKGPVKGCATREDILRRCASLDDLFRTLQVEGRLRPYSEVDPMGFREFGGIGMHIGPGGVPIRGWNGRHRFAMARILRLRFIPVRIGLVHVTALPEMNRLRLEPQRPGA